ncbi:MAG TPA: gliding motility-associated C-terminal domain-containing protein [Bacteroidales bacterium]|jgi:gliding motility-associated-like protein|nr:gliding motility-associated C-terminal domain-containing protein [Bacteroidales bacterium]
MIKVINCILLLFITGTVVLSQSVTTRDNYSGSWESPDSWIPSWNAPEDTLWGTNAIIYGTITANSSLFFTGTECGLYVRDTLIINGNLHIGNNCDLRIYEDGILIVRGDVVNYNNSGILNSGYLIITGNFVNNATTWGGYFTSTDYPTRVFIFGEAEPVQNFFYPVLFCSDSIDWHYSSSGCNYGNFSDLKSDPVYSFFNSLCGKINASYNDPVCERDLLKLTGTLSNTDKADINLRFHWQGPAGFSSDLQNPEIPGVTNDMSGNYLLSLVFEFCSISDTLNVVINPLPRAEAQCNSPVCEGESLTFTSSKVHEYSWTGPAGFSSSEQNPSIRKTDTTNSGKYTLKVLSPKGCMDTTSLIVVIKTFPVVNAGDDRILEFVFETTIAASEQNSEDSQWTLISGSGTFPDPHSASTVVKDLSPGENIFRFTAQNGNCASSDDVTIEVLDLFVPSVITPNHDGKNDYFEIRGCPERSELIIFNRWGMTVYSSDNYGNDWNGIKNSGEELPDDTYYCVLKLSSGITRKGSILVKRK